VEVHLHVISNSSLDVDEWPVSQAGRVTSQGEAFAIHILDDYVFSRGGHGGVEKIILLHVHESVHRDTTMKITNKMHYID
jgi:hypothetical protein